MLSLFQYRSEFFNTFFHLLLALTLSYRLSSHTPTLKSTCLEYCELVDWFVRRRVCLCRWRPWVPWLSFSGSIAGGTKLCLRSANRRVFAVKFPAWVREVMADAPRSRRHIRWRTALSRGLEPHSRSHWQHNWGSGRKGKKLF